MSDDIVARLRVWSDNAKEQDATEIVVGLCQAADEIERLRKERDEARRAVCYYALPSGYKEWKPEDVYVALKLVAAEQGWDCFKEATDGNA